ncbi:MAG: hypothetical protein J0665_05585 [Deltaproteobacteria bacterium]|nr:hypothetical protein [Deltaproteobacteria bacterium]
MNISHLLLSILTVSIIAGCASSGTSFPKISHEEAASYEKSLTDNYVTPSPLDFPKPLYNQPVNKKVACKLPTSSDQLQRRNFRQFWDGECKDGYAFGLGRDISISDTHHYDEITIHNGTGEYKNQPSIFYDFVNHLVKYESTGNGPLERATFTEQYAINNNTLNVRHIAELMDENANLWGVISSPLIPVKTYINSSKGVAFEFVDRTSIPAKSDDIVYEVNIKNYNQVPGGIGIIKSGDGRFRHFKMENTGQKSLVEIPKSYLDHIEAKRQEVYQAIPRINQFIENVKRTEREYLHFACNGSYKIEGLDSSTANKVCSWRNDLQPMYQAAIENSKKQLEERLKIVEKAENERMYKQQIAQQQRVIEQQRNQQDANEIINGLNNLSNSLRNSATQTQQFIQPLPIYQPTPSGSSGRINCISTGPLTSCR